MITKNQTDGAERGSISEETNFSIAGTAKAFSILSDKLYKDKIKAPIRELSTNASDSHIEAKETRPFEITLPNTFEPTFTIRDFGVGMSKEDIKSTYTTYFESTKIKSNDYNGCLGLGSKSPFAYNTRSFNVISFKDGKKFVYTAFMEKGFPKLAKMGESNTDEPNGMEISFAVARDDFRSFYSKAQDVYRYFKMKPIIKGYDEFKFYNTKYCIEGKGWAVKSDDNNTSYGNDYDYSSVAIMGNIGYPIDRLSLRACKGVSEDDVDLAKKVLDCHIDIQFKIGEVDITPSREELSYDDDTIKNIVHRAVSIGKILRAQVKKDFNGCKTLWEARVHYNKVFNNTKDGYPRSLREFVKSGISFKGTKLTDNYSIENIWYKKKTLDEKKNSRYRHSGYAHDYVGNITQFSTDYSDRVSRKITNNIMARANTETFFIENDLKTGGIACIRHLTLNTDNDAMIYHMSLDKLPKTKRKSLLKLIGITEKDILKTSKMDKPPKRAQACYARILKFDEQLTDSWNIKDRDCWKSDEIDIKNGTYYYVEIFRFSPKMKVGGQLSQDKTIKYLKEQILKFLREEAGLTIPYIYGVKSGTLAKIQKVNKEYGNWISIDELFMKHFKLYLKNYNKYWEAVDYMTRINHYRSGDTILENTTILHGIKPFYSKEFRALQKEQKKLDSYRYDMDKICPNYKFISNLLQYIKMDTSKFIKTYKRKTIEQLKQDILDKYPLLNHTNEYDNTDEVTIKRFNAYIKMVEECT